MAAYSQRSRMLALMKEQDSELFTQTMTTSEGNQRAYKLKRSPRLGSLHSNYQDLEPGSAAEEYSPPPNSGKVIDSAAPHNQTPGEGAAPRLSTPRTWASSRDNTTVRDFSSGTTAAQITGGGKARKYSNSGMPFEPDFIPEDKPSDVVYKHPSTRTSALKTFRVEATPVFEQTAKRWGFEWLDEHSLDELDDHFSKNGIERLLWKIQTVKQVHVEVRPPRRKDNGYKVVVPSDPESNNEGPISRSTDLVVPSSTVATLPFHVFPVDIPDAVSVTNFKVAAPAPTRAHAYPMKERALVTCRPPYYNGRYPTGFRVTCVKANTVETASLPVVVPGLRVGEAYIFHITCLFGEVESESCACPPIQVNPFERMNADPPPPYLVPLPDKENSPKERTSQTGGKKALDEMIRGDCVVLDNADDDWNWSAQTAWEVAHCLPYSRKIRHLIAAKCNTVRPLQYILHGVEQYSKLRTLCLRSCRVGANADRMELKSLFVQLGHAIRNSPFLTTLDLAGFCQAVKADWSPVVDAIATHPEVMVIDLCYNDLGGPVGDIEGGWGGILAQALGHRFKTNPVSLEELARHIAPKGLPQEVGASPTAQRRNIQTPNSGNTRDLLRTPPDTSQDHFDYYEEDRDLSPSEASVPIRNYLQRNNFNSPSVYLRQCGLDEVGIKCLIESILRRAAPLAYLDLRQNDAGYKVANEFVQDGVGIFTWDTFQCTNDHFPTLGSVMFGGDVLLCHVQSKIVVTMPRDQ
eukprot:TRINITY_DN102958_c0_g1_i1.p1 TRINITY_DN102958_c0_g1~~TRINITY_DN102958_c0_g1_i1.p1  ORF type:complete len:747 (-),score=74.23 TRINITY_DN102958_c0_g1_i1:68-2308(-)